MQQNYHSDRSRLGQFVDERRADGKCLGNEYDYCDSGRFLTERKHSFVLKCLHHDTRIAHLDCETEDKDQRRQGDELEQVVRLIGLEADDVLLDQYDEDSGQSCDADRSKHQ